MRTAALLTRSDIRLARTWSASRTRGSRALENRLAAHNTLRPSSGAGLHGPACLPLRTGWRSRRRLLLWGRLIYRTRPGLRRDHAASRNNGLLRCRLGRSGLCACCRGRWARRFRRRHGCGRMRRRRDHHSGRTRTLFRYRCRRLSWYRSRRLGRWRNNHGFIHGRRFGSNNRRLLRSRQRCCRRMRLARRRCRMSMSRRRGFSRRGRMLLLLAFLQQLQNIAGLGNPGEIDLGLGLGMARLLLRRRAGLGRKILSDLCRLIVLKGARVGFLLGYAEFL